MKKNLTGIILSYLVVYIVWGSTYLFIKIAVASIPPFYVLALRFLAGGIVFLLIAWAGGKLKPLPNTKQVLSSMLLGVLLLLIGNGLVSIALGQTDSYIAALLIACTPFYVAGLNRLIYREKISMVRLVGIIAGVLGVALILYVPGHAFLKISPSILLIFAGLISWGTATSIGHNLPVYPNNLVNSGIQMLTAGILSLVVSLLFYPAPATILKSVTLSSGLAALYLTILGAGAFYAFNYLLQHEPSVRITSYSIVNPLIAVILGIIFGKERPVHFLLAGLPIIITGLVLMLYGDRMFFRKKNIIQTAKSEE